MEEVNEARQNEAINLLTTFKDYIEDVEEPEEVEEVDDEDDEKVKDDIAEEDDFDDDLSESVGDEEDIEDEDTHTERTRSPHKTSSIAKSFKTMGILSTIEDEKINSIKNYSELSRLLDEEVNNRLDKKRSYIDSLLSQNVPINIIQQYTKNKEDLLAFKDEDYEDPQNLEGVKQHVFSDLMMKGYSQEDALDLVESYVKKGVLPEKAKQATQNHIKRLDAEIQKYIDAEKQDGETAKKIYKQGLDLLQKSIDNDNSFFDELQITKKQRNDIFEVATMPSTTLDNGNIVSELDAYAQSNPITFKKYVAMFYVLTNGFTDIKKLISVPVKKGVSKGVRDLAKALEGGNVRANNDLSYKTGVSASTDLDFDLSHYTLG